jgi:signal transduction histidine kinase
VSREAQRVFHSGHATSPFLTNSTKLRRDLHDGLGPALAGITLGLEAAGRTASREQCTVSALMADLRNETAACLAEVRQISANLRPPGDPRRSVT